MNRIPAQIPLTFRWPESSSLDDWQDVAEPPLKPLVRQFVLGQCDEMLLYLWGSAGTGRTLLLQGAAQAASEAGQTVMYLPVRELVTCDSGMLEGLESLDLLCIDDLDALSEPSLAESWQQAFFHLFNRCREAGCRWLVSAAVSPRELPLTLPDLVSRMQWGIVRQVPRLDEDSMFAFWTERARERGIVIDDEVRQFIMRRATRDLPALLHLLDELDHLSLAEQRRITVPFIKKVTGW